MTCKQTHRSISVTASLYLPSAARTRLKLRRTMLSKTREPQWFANQSSFLHTTSRTQGCKAANATMKRAPAAR